MNFQESVEEAKNIEKNALPFQAQTKDDSAKLLELETQRTEFTDLLNQYEKVEKIISIYKSGILIKGTPQIKEEEKKVAKEIEIEMQKNTEKTLVTAQEIAQVKESPKPEIELEKETKPEIELEKDSPKSSDIIEREVPQSREEMIIEKPKPAIVAKEEKIETREPIRRDSEREERKVPEFLEETAPKQKITLPSNMSEKEIKIRMLELTKQLFKEKITSKKEEIKMEISMLKRMLSGESEAPEETRSLSAEKQPIIIDAILEKYTNEANSVIDEIDERYNDQLNKLREEFSIKIGSAKNDGEKKSEFEALVTKIKEIIEKIGSEIQEKRDMIVSKERSELKDMQESQERQEQIEKSIKAYSEEFEEVKISIAKELDALIDSATAKVFGEASVEDSKGVEEIEEIDTMTPTALLNYLKANKPEVYKKYEKKQLSKSKAVLKAKIAIAKEKGVNKKVIDKYFPEKD